MVTRENMIDSINDMLSDMDDEQIKNCLVYVENESSEKNYEDHALKILIATVEERVRMECKAEGAR